MTLIYGKRAEGKLELIKATAGDHISRPGEIFEVHFETEAVIQDEQQVLNQVLSLEQNIPDLRVVYAETCSCGQKVKMQVTDVGPGGFSIVGLLGSLPMIMVAIGIIVVAIVGWQLMGSNPIGFWAVVVVGAAVAFFVLFSEKLPFLKAEKTIYERGPKEEKTQRQLAVTESKRKAAENLVTSRSSIVRAAEESLRNRESALTYARQTDPPDPAIDTYRAERDEAKADLTEAKRELREAEANLKKYS